MPTPLVSPTVQDMLQQVRRILKQPDPNNSNWSDSDLLAYLNEGVRVHFAELAAANEGHFTAKTTLDLVANQETVDLPSDFYQIRALYKATGQDNVLLTYRNNLTESYAARGEGTSELYTPSYYFRGNSIVLRPIPAFSQEDGLVLEYIQFPETLLNGSDQLTAQISPVFRQVVEAYAVYMAKFDESLVTGANTYALAERRLSDLLDQFRKLIAPRSKNPTYVQAWNPEG